MKSHDPKYIRTLERREARARRSKLLGRVLFLCLSVSLTLTMRMNPALATDIISQISAHQSAQLPETAPISTMPLNHTKVNKGIATNT